MTKSWPTIILGLALAFFFAPRNKSMIIEGRKWRPEPALIAPAFVDLSSKTTH